MQNIQIGTYLYPTKNGDDLQEKSPNLANKKSLFGFPTAALPSQLYKLEKINLMQTNQVLITEQRYYPQSSLLLSLQSSKTQSCEEIGIFARKFILNAKLSYIRKTRGFMPFSSIIVLSLSPVSRDLYNKTVQGTRGALLSLFNIFVCWVFSLR